MILLDGSSAQLAHAYLAVAAQLAQQSTCKRGHCGAVIVAGETIVGQGYTAPPRGSEACRHGDISVPPDRPRYLYDATCCLHAEWRAIMDALSTQPQLLEHATLYFLRIDAGGRWKPETAPYCTTCSRLILEVGISYVCVWHKSGYGIYASQEFDSLAYTMHQATVA